MKRIIYASLFSLLAISFIYGQNNVEETVILGSTNRTYAYESFDCPTIDIENPSNDFKAGELATYTINLTGDFDKKKTVYKWDVENGTIVSGQGTPTLQIATTADSKLNLSKVTLTISGIHKSCQSVLIAENIGKPIALNIPRLIDEFGKSNEEDMRARLDAFLVELQNNPNATGYLINYALIRKVGERERTIRNHFTYRKFDLSRIVFVNGGIEKEIRTRLWIIPLGADASTID